MRAPYLYVLINDMNGDLDIVHLYRYIRSEKKLTGCPQFTIQSRAVEVITSVFYHLCAQCTRTSSMVHPALADDRIGRPRQEETELN